MSSYRFPISQDFRQNSKKYNDEWQEETQKAIINERNRISEIKASSKGKINEWIKTARHNYKVLRSDIKR